MGGMWTRVFATGKAASCETSTRHMATRATPPLATPQTTGGPSSSKQAPRGTKRGEKLQMQQHCLHTDMRQVARGSGFLHQNHTRT